jgi:hypothetical protein
MRAYRSPTVGGGAAMAAASDCLQAVATMIQTFRKLLGEPCATTTLWGATLGDQSKLCWLVLQEFSGRGEKLAQQINYFCAEEACYLLELKEDRHRRSRVSHNLWLVGLWYLSLRWQ